MTESICSVPNCGREHSARGLCAGHWQRWRKHGDVRPDVPLRRVRPNNMSVADAFNYYMSGPPLSSGCWSWSGPRNLEGYGVIRDGRSGRSDKLLAHRVSYELFVGPISDGLLICHRCDNPPCCHPDHLYPGTAADNSRDMVVRGRSTRGLSWGRGAANSQAKLSPNDVADIRRRFAAGGVSQTALAGEYGLSQASVGRIVNGRGWRDDCLGDLSNKIPPETLRSEPQHSRPEKPQAAHQTSTQVS